MTRSYQESDAQTFKREPLTQSEASDLSNAAKSPIERLIVWTLLDTGLRVDELASLGPDNIDWQTHRLVFKGKFSKRRTVDIPPRVRALLEPYFAINHEFGPSVRTIQRTVRTVANRARIQKRVTPHVLRHTFAVTALQKGISLPALQKILGHENLQTTAIYLNLSPEEALREFREKW